MQNNLGRLPGGMLNLWNDSHRNPRRYDEGKLEELLVDRNPLVSLILFIVYKVSFNKKSGHLRGFVKKSTWV